MSAVECNGRHECKADSHVDGCFSVSPVFRRPYEELHAEIDELALELSQERLLAQELHDENQRLREALEWMAREWAKWAEDTPGDPHPELVRGGVEMALSAARKAKP